MYKLPPLFLLLLFTACARQERIPLPAEETEFLSPSVTIIDTRAIPDSLLHFLSSTPSPLEGGEGVRSFLPCNPCPHLPACPKYPMLPQLT